MGLELPRVILKLSGEALAGKGDRGICLESAGAAAKQIAEARDAGCQIGVVLGAGNLWRGRDVEAGTFDMTRSHQMGLLATIINALAFCEVLSRSGVPSTVYSAVPAREIVPELDIDRAKKELAERTVVIFSGGTGNPYFTTDSAAALRAVEVGANAILKATKVNGVYDSDPMKNPGAKRFDEISFTEALSRDLEVMDTTAFALCRDNGIPIVVFNMTEPSAVVRIVKGERIGTLVRA